MKYIISKVEILYLYHATLLSRQHTNAVLGLKSMLDRLPTGDWVKFCPGMRQRLLTFSSFPKNNRLAGTYFRGNGWAFVFSWKTMRLRSMRTEVCPASESALRNSQSERFQPAKL